MVNRLKLVQELGKYPVFTTKTLRDITGKARSYCNLVAYRLKKAGAIQEIERNKYTVHEDPMVFASCIVWPSYISGWAALRYHNLTEQLPVRIDIVTTRPRKNRELRVANGTILFTRTEAKRMVGYGRMPYQGFSIFMAEKEKAVADALVFNKVSEEELIEIVRRHRKELDMKALSRYVRRVVRAGWTGKAKRFLERVGCDAD